MSVKFFEFLAELRAFVGASGKETDELMTLLKRTKFGVRSIEDILSDLNVKKINSFFTIGEDIPLNKLETVLKEGDLIKLKSLTKSSVEISKLDVVQYKQLVGKTSESVLNDLDKMIDENKRIYKQLNVTLDELKKLPENLKRDINTVEKNLFKYVKYGVFIPLTVGGIWVTNGWLVRETKKREGCYMYITIDNVIKNCKVAQFSCQAIAGYECSSDININYYNITLNAIYIAELKNDNELKINLSKNLDVNVEDFYKQLPSLLDTKFDIISRIVNSVIIPVSSICKVVHEGIEKNIVPTCRMCDPSAHPISTEYIDSKQLASNVSFKCVTDLSILDVVTDIAKTTGNNIIDFGSNIFSKLKIFGIGAIILVICIFLLNIISYIIKTTRNQTSQVNLKFAQ